MFVKSAVIRFFLFFPFYFFSCYCVRRLVQLVAWDQNTAAYYVRTSQI